MLFNRLTPNTEERTMKKLVWGLAAGFLVISAISLQAGEKRYQIRLAAIHGDVFGKPVAFQEIVPAPEPFAAPGGIPVAPPEPTPVSPPTGLQPIPEPYSGIPVSPPGGAEYQTIELYHRVKYEDLDNIHPFAVKKIVAVKDPCVRRDVCGNCAPPCVYVMICVPPGDRFQYDVKRRDHSKVEYDYGDYEVEITSKDGVVYVDYDD
jgi:hypothetical protein